VSVVSAFEFAMSISFFAFKITSALFVNASWALANAVFMLEPISEILAAESKTILPPLV
jgi:hypothetical protein